MNRCWLQIAKSLTLPLTGVSARYNGAACNVKRANWGAWVDGLQGRGRPTVDTKSTKVVGLCLPTDSLLHLAFHEN